MPVPAGSPGAAAVHQAALGPRWAATTVHPASGLLTAIARAPDSFLLVAPLPGDMGHTTDTGLCPGGPPPQH